MSKREEYIEKINQLAVGKHIRKNGKEYEIKAIYPYTEYLAVRDVVLLERGKPETYEVAGVGLAKGKMITISNLVRIDVRAQAPYMQWDII